MSFAQGGAPQRVLLSELFRIGPDVPDTVAVAVTSADETVATARIDGAGLTAVVAVEPAGPGFTRVHVVVAIGAAHVVQSLRVQVVPPAMEPPRADNRLSSFTLSERGVPIRLYARHLFRIEGDIIEVEVARLEAHSPHTAVATAEVVTGFGLNHVLVTPGAPGTTRVRVTMTNAAGSASVRVPVTVARASRLRVGYQPIPVVFLPGMERELFAAEDLFEPPGATLEVRSGDPGVVEIEAEPFYRGWVILRPVGPGTTSVLVTASNPVSEATLEVGVTVHDRIRFGLFNGLGDPAAPVRLTEGSQWELDVRALDLDLVEVENLPPGPASLRLGLVTDAPSADLRVPPSVAAGPLFRALTPAPVVIEAPTDETADEAAVTYSVSLAPNPDLPEWAELSGEPVRVIVSDSPAARCEDLRVDAVLEGRSGGIAEGNLVVQSPHPDTRVSLASPYAVPDVARGTAVSLVSHVLPEVLAYRTTSDGFEQTLRVRWWKDDLRLAVETPGCEPVTVVCDNTRCEVE